MEYRRCIQVELEVGGTNTAISPFCRALVLCRMVEIAEKYSKKPFGFAYSSCCTKQTGKDRHMITCMQSADNPSLKCASFGKRVNIDNVNIDNVYIVPCTISATFSLLMATRRLQQRVICVQNKRLRYFNYLIQHCLWIYCRETFKSGY